MTGKLTKQKNGKREEGGMWSNNGAMCNKSVGTYGIVMLGHTPMHRSRGVGRSNLSLERDNTQGGGGGGGGGSRRVGRGGRGAPL